MAENQCDQQLSDAVVAYVRVPGMASADARPVRGAETMDNGSLDDPQCLGRVEAMLRELYCAGPDLWNHSDIREVGRRAEDWLRQRYPQLSDAAVDAMTNRFTFDWR